MRLSYRHLDHNFALQRLIWCLSVVFRFRAWPLRKTWPSVGYCDCCGMWTWRTNEAIAYSTGSADLCQNCAENEREDVSRAWADYYGGLL